MTACVQYLAAVYNGPILRADAVVVLSGDGANRLAVAVEMFRQGAAHHVVLSGGVDDPPFSLSADRLAAMALGAGVPHDRLILEAESQNTREQAVNVVAIAKKSEWQRILVSASPFHVPRAHLTFVRALDDAGMSDKLHVLMIGATQTAWFKAPDGKDATRMSIFGEELDKCGRYVDHVATWERGLEYLQYWEGR